jgi:hypothetical protein
MRFKDLRKKLAEGLPTSDTYGGYVVGTKVGPMDSQDNAVDKVNTSVHQLSVQELRRLNTFVGAMEDKSYIDPNAAINQMKQKLFTQGISFDFNLESVLEDGTHTFPLKQYGGREGHDGTSYNPIKDDGISHRLGHGLDLMLTVQRESNGMTRMSAKIVANNGNPNPGSDTTPNPRGKAGMQGMNSGEAGMYNKNPFTNPTFSKPGLG